MRNHTLALLTLIVAGCHSERSRQTAEDPAFSGARVAAAPDAVCDSVATSWRGTGRADVQVTDANAVVVSDAAPQRGCMVLTSAPQGVDRAQAAGLYWATSEEHGWTELREYMADGPDGTSRTRDRDGTRCQIDFSQDGGKDSEPTYVPSPAVSERTFCWRLPRQP